LKIPPGIREKKTTNGVRYEVRYRNPGSREIRGKTFDTLTEAKRFQRELETAKDRGTYVNPSLGKTTFGAYADRYMNVTLNQDISTKTRDESLLRNHLVPAFGAMSLREVTTPSVRAWIADLSETKQLAPSTVALCYQLLGRIMRNAEEDGYIFKTPCTPNIKLPNQTHSKRAERWLSIEELERLADTIDPRFRAAILTMGYMGLRFGELTGLKRSRLDLLHGTLDVSGQMKEVGGHQSFANITKTAAGLRKLPIPPSLVSELGDHLSTYSNHPEFVFSGRDGGPLRKTWARRHFTPAVTKAGLSPLTPHHLRHTCAALLIAEGAHAKDIQEWLGHSSYQVTMDVYGHLFPERQGELAASLDAKRTSSPWWSSGGLFDAAEADSDGSHVAESGL
jgi:integrase